MISRFAFLFLLTALVNPLSAEPGFYSLTKLTGSGTREWETFGCLDTLYQYCPPPITYGTIFLNDTVVSPGEIVLKEDGTLTAKWSHKIELTYTYQPNFFLPDEHELWQPDPTQTEGDPFEDRDNFDNQYYWNIPWEGGPYDEVVNPNEPNHLEVILNTTATGTWSGGSSLNLSFECSVDSTSIITYLPPESTEPETEVLVNQGLPVSFTTTGTCSDGAVSFTWDSLEVWLPELAAVYYTGDKYVAVDDALRITGKRTDVGINDSQGGSFMDFKVRDWDYEETEVQGPLLGATCKPSTSNTTSRTWRRLSASMYLETMVVLKACRKCVLSTAGNR